MEVIVSNFEIEIKNYEAPGVNMKEAFRYAGCRGEVPQNIQELFDICLPEALRLAGYKVCFMRVPLNREILRDGIDFEREKTEANKNKDCKIDYEVKIKNLVDFGFTKVESAGLKKNLTGCKEAIIFGATVGIGIDRLISKYGKVSVAKGLVMQAIGAERIESLCDVFNDEVNNMLACEGKGSKPRFSPGYEDLDISFQKEIFKILNLSKNAGIFLNDSMLMSPSKSVTGIIGIYDLGLICSDKLKLWKNEPLTQPEEKNKCATCSKKDCAFRSL